MYVCEGTAQWLADANFPPSPVIGKPSSIPVEQMKYVIVICIYIYIYIYMLFVCMYVCMYVRMYVCVCVPACVCV